MKVKFLVTPVGLMMGNIISAKRVRAALINAGITVIDDPAENDYDILHVHTPIPPNNMIIARKAKKRGKPVVMHAHTTADDAVGTWTGSRALTSFVQKYLTFFYNIGDMVFAPSDWTKERLRSCGVTVPITVLSNGIDVGRFKFDAERRHRFRDRYGISETETVAYMIGAICMKKGIQPFYEVTKAHPEIRFVWVGRRFGLYHPFKINRLIAQSPKNVQFIQDVDDIVDAHCGGDIFFTPSLVENQGMAVMEAMSVGRPVVARNLPSYDGLLTNGKSALLCSGTEEFRYAISRLTQDPALGRALVDEAKNNVLKHEIKTVSRELIKIYSSLLEGSRSQNYVKT